jgi:dihydropteroate synthase
MPAVPRISQLRARARTSLRRLAKRGRPRRQQILLDVPLAEFITSLEAEIKICRDADVPVREIVAMLRDELGIEVSERTIWRALGPLRESA